MLKGSLKEIWDVIKYALGLLFAHGDEVLQHPINQPDTTTSPVVSAADQLKITAMAWLGKDCSPQNRAPQELSCAEGVVNLVNMTWPNTLSKDIIGTAVLFNALKRSPRFKGSLDPAAGSIIISPTQGKNVGHVGIFLSRDRIASNNSATGLLGDNYSFRNWISSFKGKGLHVYILQPVDIA